MPSARIPDRASARSARRARRVAAACAAAALAAACGREAARPVTLALLDFQQRDARGVFLNEDLVFHFSRDVDRSSVTRTSVVVKDARGRTVDGRLLVDGARVSFRPALPTRADLLDGAFVPGARYTVELIGFPFPDGVRALDGPPLERCETFAFSTVALGDPPRGDEVVFAPVLLDVPAYLSVSSSEVGPVDPIVVTVDQPIDPRSLKGRVLELLDGSTPLDLRVDLVRNDEDGARIELFARGDGRDSLRALEPGAWYVLRLAPDAELPRTLGGIPVQLSWWGSVLGGARIAVHGSAMRAQRVEFQEGGPLWSVQPVPDADGTATWADGAVSIRYPAAAGTGADGEVRLDRVPDPRDVHATRLELPAESTTTLPAEGLVVLRAQGRMTLEGALRRPAPETPAPPMTFPPGETLSAWLARARAEDPAWTVLIAGGDLAIGVGPGDAGGVDVAGPLLLVAGGRLRIADALRADALWRLAPGDQVDLSLPELRWVPTARDPGLPPEARFVVDAPIENPLVEPLTFSVLSASFRPPAGVAAWRPGRWGSRDGAGEARVRFVGQRFVRDGVEEYGPVDDVLLLAGSDALRFRIDLHVPARPSDDLDPALPPDLRLRLSTSYPWDPPQVDHVELRWEEPLPAPPDAR